MESVISKFFFHNWQRKVVALLAALVIWLFVDRSITETKAIPNVPIRVINLPSDKTIVGLLPNRLLSKRVTLNLSGSKDVVSEIEPGDLEVLLDVSTADSDEWVVKISKKNLISLNPALDLAHNITHVSHNEFVLKLSPLVTAKIPIEVIRPTGEAPEGFEFLDVWPQKLTQTVTAGEEEIQALKLQGLELVLNLSDITKADLEAIKSPHGNASDEISFVVPAKWRKITQPLQNLAQEEINDPDAQNLRIDFLRKSYLPLNKQIAVRVFYPLNHTETLNPKTFPLEIKQPLIQTDEVPRMAVPLFVRDVSRLFLDIVNDYLEIAVVAAPKSERNILAWSLEVIDPHELEDMYVAFVFADAKAGVERKREQLLRNRFKSYIQRLALYTGPEQKLRLDSSLGADSIQVNVIK